MISIVEIVVRTQKITNIGVTGVFRVFDFLCCTEMQPVVTEGRVSECLIVRRFHRVVILGIGVAGIYGRGVDIMVAETARIRQDVVPYP